MEIKVMKTNKRYWIYVYTTFSYSLTGWYKVGAHYGVDADFRIKQQDSTSDPEMLDSKFKLDVTKLVNKIVGSNASLEQKHSALLKIESEIREYIIKNLGFKEREDKKREWVKTYSLNPIYLAINKIHFYYNVPRKRLVILEPKGKYEWQDFEVVQPALKHFENHSRGHSIVYCGGGKTMMTYWFCRQYVKKYNLVVIALPSLQLVAQTRDNINKQQVAREEHWNHISICSENNIGNLSNNTTDIEDIKQWIESTQHDSNLRIIFTTYQSGKILSEAIKELNQGIDIIIFDESHKATGRRNSLFTHLLDDNNIKADKRWFVTATPKYNLRNREDAFGFNNKEVFGNEICKIDYRTLLKYNMVTAFKLNCLGVNNEIIKEFIEENVWVKLEEFDQETQSRFIASLFALHMAYEKGIITRVISYHSRNLYAERFEQVLKTLSQSKHPKFPAFHNLEVYRCEGGDTKGNKQKLNALSKAKKAIVTNARVLTEGIDVPAIDGIIFVDPKKSLVDINQAVGRVVRKLKGKEFGHVILPSIFEGNRITDETYAYLGAVMWHISQIDELLKDDITFARDRSSRQVITTPNINNIIEISTPDYVDIKFDEFCNNLILQAIDFSTFSRNNYSDEELIEMFKECKSVPDCRRLNSPAFLVYKNRGLLDKQFPNRKKANKQSDNEIICALKRYDSPREARQSDENLYEVARYRKLLKIIWPSYYIESNTSTKYSEPDFINFIKENNIKTIQEVMEKGGSGLYQYMKKYKLDKKYNILSAKTKIVNQFKDGIFIKKWVGVNSILKEYPKMNSVGIVQCCAGKQKTAFGYTWEYSNDNNFKLDIK
jgi:superfamily II DNA or RNA helicase